MKQKTNKKLIKKHSFWDMHGANIKLIIKTTFCLLLFSVVLIVVHSKTNNWLLTCKYISLFILICNVLYLLVIWLLKLKRQLYIPLTKEELKEFNIHNSREYVEYIDKFLFNMLPNEKIRTQLIESAKDNFDDDFMFKEYFIERNSYKVLILTLNVLIFILFITN